MLKTIFFYKCTETFEAKLINLNRCNRCWKIFIIEPIYFNEKYIFERNTPYIAIEYFNYQIDPFFQDTKNSIQAECFKTKFSFYGLFDNKSPCIVYIDVILPLMPTEKILKKMNVSMICTKMLRYGIYKGAYKITFSRKYVGNVESLLRNLYRDVEKNLPKMPILVSAFYTAHWLC